MAIKIERKKAEKIGKCKKKNAFSNCRTVSAIRSAVFVPIIQWLCEVAVTAFAITVHLCLDSIGKPVNHIVKMDSDALCKCTGPAMNYTVKFDEFWCHFLLIVICNLQWMKNARLKVVFNRFDMPRMRPLVILGRSTHSVRI